MKDEIYSETQEVKPFLFDKATVTVFDDMIERSVPLYRESLKAIIRLASNSFIEGTAVYDLGCSLGAFSIPMQMKLKGKKGKIIAVDNSEAMINKLRERITKDAFDIDLINDDINNIEFEPSSVVILNYTLQFIEKEKRNKLIKKVYNSLVPNGILLLSEKVVSNDEALTNATIEEHHDFKRNNGYSELEIAQKRDSLETVLIPEDIDTHIKRLKEAGFTNPEVWHRYLNFTTIFARKAKT